MRSIRDASHALRRRDISAIELLDESLSVIGATEDILHAWVDVDFERAMSEAEAADRA